MSCHVSSGADHPNKSSLFPPDWKFNVFDICGLMRRGGGAAVGRNGCNKETPHITIRHSTLIMSAKRKSH